jgi:hypothetical protein
LSKHKKVIEKVGTGFFVKLNPKYEEAKGKAVSGSQLDRIEGKLDLLLQEKGVNYE